MNILMSSEASRNGIYLVGAVNSTTVRKTSGNATSAMRIILRRNNIFRIIDKPVMILFVLILIVPVQGCKLCQIVPFQ